MASKAKIAFGGKVERSTNGTTYTRMAEIKTFAIPIGKPEFQDVTNLDSPNAYMEVIPGLNMVDDVSLAGNWTPEEYDTAIADMESRVPIYYKITMPLFAGQTTAGVSTFTAYPIIGAPTNTVGEVMQLEIALKVTGEPVWTPGA